MTETSMNIHFHGMNVSPLCGGDDVVHTLVNSGKTFHYQINVPNDEPPGLYWYHPHVHGIAEAALQGGASGVIVVEGIETLQPSVAGLPERILVIRDQVVAGGPAPGGVVPSWDISVNYVPISYPAMVPSVIRAAGHGKEFWRVANASADTVLDLQLTYDGVVQTLQVVGLGWRADELAGWRPLRPSRAGLAYPDPDSRPCGIHHSGASPGNAPRRVTNAQHRHRAAR